MATTETRYGYRLIKFGNDPNNVRYTASISTYAGEVVLSVDDIWQSPGDPPSVQLSSNDIDELIDELEAARKELLRG